MNRAYVCLYSKRKKERKKNNKTVVTSITTDMFMSVRQRKIRTKMCKKLYRKEKEMKIVANTFFRVISL